MNCYLFIKVKRGGGALVHVYVWEQSHAALNTESFNGYLPNLVGIKYSWPRTFVLIFGPNPPRADPGQGHNRSTRGPFSKELAYFAVAEGWLLLDIGWLSCSFSDRKATVTLCNVHVYKWENAYSREVNAWGILMNFYLFIKMKSVGVTSVCICIGTQKSALTAESLDGYLPNLVGINYSWPLAHLYWLLGQILPRSGSKAGP